MNFKIHVLAELSLMGFYIDRGLLRSIMQLDKFYQ